MVETRSGLSVEPPEGEEAGSPATPAAAAKQADTASAAVAARSGGRRRSRGGEAGGEEAHALTDSQAYTLLALALLVAALPCIFTPKLVRGPWSRRAAAAFYRHPSACACATAAEV